jgi:hypothetical protein
MGTEENTPPAPSKEQRKALKDFLKAATELIRLAPPGRNGARLPIVHPITGVPLHFDVRWMPDESQQHLQDDNNVDVSLLSRIGLRRSH